MDPAIDREVIMGADDYRDLVITKFTDKRLKDGISTIADKITVRGNHKKAKDYVRTNYGDENIFSNGSDNLIVVLDDGIIEAYPQNNAIEFRMHGTFEFNDDFKNKLLETFEEIVVYINWIYDKNMNRVTVPVDSTMTPVAEMYPWLNGEDLHEFYDRYLESNASILILIGPPGTGKTSFIRGLLHHSKSSALVTYDEAVLGSDGLFSELLEGQSDILVIEDADLILASRKEGNNMMHKFLNVGDGLVTVRGKKIIFSTNLPNINDIDDALLRPGRCFDILKFEDLDMTEAKALVETLNIDFNFEDGKHRYTVAEIFSGIRNSSRKSKNKFGFLKE